VELNYIHAIIVLRGCTGISGKWKSRGNRL